MRIDPEQVDAMKRGGRPTLEELAQHLVFRPLDASIKLAGARMMLQRASNALELRDTLIERHGEQEAKISLMRIGYRAGVADARFIRETWPNINSGDAFTAGTRLHMLSGTVSVETLGNDFDFERSRYASEFLWHNSIEATEYQRAHGRAAAPVCWMQIGYASGYASHFFRRLVVYREKHCAAMGHKHCHLQGGTVDRWGEDDPLVQLFKTEIIPAPSPGIRRKQPAAPSSAAAPASGTANAIDALLLEPSAERIARIAAAGLPALFVGPPGSGRRAGARAYLAQVAPDRTPSRMHASAAEVADLLAEFDTPPGSASEAPQPWLIEEIEHLTPAQQATFAHHLGSIPGGAVILAATAGPVTPGLDLSSDLFHAFTAVRLPALAERSDLARLAALIASDIAAGIGLAGPVELAPAAIERLRRLELAGNAAQLRAVLRDALLSAQGPTIGPDLLPEPASHPEDTSLPMAALRKALAAGRLNVDALSRDLCTEALTLSGGNVSAAARMLGLRRAQLDYRLRKTDRGGFEGPST